MFFMYRIFLLFCLVLGMQANAQLLESIKTSMKQKEWKMAKDSIDLYLLRPGNAKQADGWYYKGVIYNFYSREKQAEIDLSSTLKLQSFEALKKCLSITPNYRPMLLGDHAELFDLYNGFFELANAQYKLKKYEDSYQLFVHTQQVQQYIYFKGFSYRNFKFHVLDTMVVKSMALSARQAGMQPEAVAAYQQLANAKLGGDQYLEMYQYLADMYLRMSNDKAFLSTVQTAKELYPYNEYWDQIELDFLRNNKKNQELITKYQVLVGQQPKNFTIHYNYATDLFNMIYVSNTAPAQRRAYKQILNRVLDASIQIEKNGRDAELLKARHLFNHVFDLQADARQLSASQDTVVVRRRTQLNNDANLTLRSCVASAERVLNYYTTQKQLLSLDKQNLKTTLDILARCHTTLGNDQKANFYKARLAQLKS
jgi:hypothetical protein